jgi:hypothetical protein
MQPQHAVVADNAVERYVVSADIRLLLMRWATQRGFTLPSLSFFDGMRADFIADMRGIFPGFVLLSEDELRQRIAGITGAIKVPTIRLDPIYCAGEYDLHLCRYTDKATGEVVGVTNRPGSSPLAEQIAQIAQKLGKGRVALADDVVFSGKLLRDVVIDLGDAGITVETLIVGIGIGEGVERLQKLVPDIRCAFVFDSVVDQVCERDFYAGVPLSGRLMAGEENIGMPYMLPFGDPVKWASIPQASAAWLSRNCVRRSMELFIEIGRVSGRDVLVRDLPRKVASPTMDYGGAYPFAAFLRDHL